MYCCIVLSINQSTKWRLQALECLYIRILNVNTTSNSNQYQLWPLIALRFRQCCKCFKILYYFFADAFDELADKLSNSLVTYFSVSIIQFSTLLFSVNFIVIFQTVAKISQIYRGGILISAICYNWCSVSEFFLRNCR